MLFELLLFSAITWYDSKVEWLIYTALQLSKVSITEYDTLTYRLELNNINLSFEQMEQPMIMVFKMTIILLAVQYFVWFVNN